jgi:hypothetical protein
MINRATSSLYNVVNIRPSWGELHNPELSEEDGVYYYSADFSLTTFTSDGHSGPSYRARIKLKHVEGKWRTVTSHVEDVP